MSAYYGVVTGGTGMVLCHKVTVQTYTKRLPNGKTVTVQGYTREGDAAQEAVRRNTNRYYDRRTAAQIRSGRTGFTNAKVNVATGASRFRQGTNAMRGNAVGSGMHEYGKGVREEAVGQMKTGIGQIGQGISSYAGAVGTKAKQLAYNAKNAWNDAKEVMSVGIGNFMEQAKLAGSYIGAAIQAGISWLGKLIGGIPKAVSNAYTNTKKVLTTEKTGRSSTTNSGMRTNTNKHQLAGPSR